VKRKKSAMLATFESGTVITSCYSPTPRRASGSAATTPSARARRPVGAGGVVVLTMAPVEGEGWLKNRTHPHPAAHTPFRSRGGFPYTRR
jgi:hypothetical protein